MSRYGLDEFLYRFDKDLALQRQFADDPEAALAAFDLDERERRALRDGDVATLYEWGVHALLIRNFAGARKIAYVDEYRKRGLS